MPQHLTLKISADEAVRKFFLREMLFFFIERRQKVILDSPFSFTAKDFSTYIKGVEFSQTVGVHIDNDHIKENLKILRDGFLKRDKMLKVKEPQEHLLKFSERDTGDRTVFTIKNCPTDYINNALRFLDISLMLNTEVEDRKRIGDLELQRKIESINEESLFGQNQNHHLTFCNKISDRPLGLKEKAIFNTLVNGFKTEVSSAQIYGAIANLTRITKRANERNSYVNDGIIELRKKLHQMSGNPETILTIRGTTSAYKLVY